MSGVSKKESRKATSKKTKSTAFARNQTAAAGAAGAANLRVQSWASATAASSSSRHCLAMPSSSGSSGFGALSRACTEIKTVRICRAGDHLSFKMSRQMRPSLSMLGW